MTRKRSSYLKGNSNSKQNNPSTQLHGPWYSAKQIAEYLALPSHRSVRELERRGILPGHRFGGSLRFSRSEIDRVLLRSRQDTVDESLGDKNRVSISLDTPLGPFLTPEDAAAYLGLPSTESVYMRVYRGQIPVYRIGDKILRYRAVDLDQVLLTNSLTRISHPSILDDDARLQEGKGGNGYGR